MTMPDVFKIERVTGRAVPLRGRDIDTDRIIPARFLKAVTFEGLERHVFEDERLALRRSGATHPFDNPAYAGAAILVAGANFGCGSSREHAPQALARWGIHAIVAESFAEIFAGNALTLGLPCLTAPAADIERLMALVEAAPQNPVAVDIRTATLTAADAAFPLALPRSAQDALLSGDWNATALLVDRYEEVERTAARLPYLTGFQL
jgi:3-isopropylmalate/(R)-2-methylmalate dehydratase small subunit